MNKDQIWAMIRWGLTFVGGILVTKGYLTSADLNVVISDAGRIFTSVAEMLGPLAAATTIISSLIIHTKAATVARAADIVPIPASTQKSAGVTTPVLVPTRPKEM